MRPLTSRVTTFFKRIFGEALLFSLLGPGVMLAIGLFNPASLIKSFADPAFHFMLLSGYLLYWVIAVIWMFIEEILLGRKIQRAAMTYDWLGVPDPCEPVSDGLPTTERV